MDRKGYAPGRNYCMLLLLLFIVLLSFLIDKMLREKFNIEKGDFIYQHVNSWHKWLEILLIVISLVIMYFAADIVNPAYFSLATIGVLWGGRSVVERVYHPESKIYITHALASVTILIIFSIIFFFTYPRDINYTVNGFMYSDSGKINEAASVQLIATVKRDIISQDSVNGQLNINDQEFLLITAANKLSKSDIRHFEIIEIGSGRSKGLVWITGDYQTILGNAKGLSIDPSISITLVAPAETIEEAKQIYSEIAEF